MKKIIIAILTLALLCCVSFTGCGKTVKLPEREAAVTETTMVRELPRAMVFRSAGATVSPYNTVTVHATVKPDNATVKTVDWSVSFVNASSSWATGKTATDYVTVTPETDGSTTATISCLQPFGEQIRVTVTSRDKVTATASCTVDFAKRVDHITVIGENNPVNLTLNYKNNDNMANTQSFAPMVSYTDYTVNDEFEYQLYVKYSQAFLNKLKEKYPEIRFQGGMSYVSDTYWSEYHEAPYNTFYFGTVVTVPVGGIMGAYSYTNYTETVKNILADNPSLGYFITYKAVYTGTYSSFETEVPMKYDTSTFKYEVDSVLLDESTIII